MTYSSRVYTDGKFARSLTNWHCSHSCIYSYYGHEWYAELVALHA